MREKLEMLFRRFVLYPRNFDGEFGQVVRENLVILFRWFILFALNVRCSRESPNNCEPCSEVEWPYVMNSNVAMTPTSQCIGVSFRRRGFGTINMHTGITGITELAVKRI